MNLTNWQTQLRKGLLDLAILNLLRHERIHGYELVRRLKDSAGIEIREGNVYPILSRLQTDGLVTHRVEASSDGPARKYYELTPIGESYLTEMNRHWDQMVSSMEHYRKGTVGHE